VVAGVLDLALLLRGDERQLEVHREVQRHRRQAAAARHAQLGPRARDDPDAALQLLELGVHVRGAARAVARPIARHHLVELLACHVPAPPESSLLDFVNVDAHLSGQGGGKGASL
jgi:hypothetical protein